MMRSIFGALAVSLLVPWGAAAQAPDQGAATQDGTAAGDSSQTMMGQMQEMHQMMQEMQQMMQEMRSHHANGGMQGMQGMQHGQQDGATGMQGMQRGQQDGATGMQGMQRGQQDGATGMQGMQRGQQDGATGMQGMQRGQQDGMQQGMAGPRENCLASGSQGGVSALLLGSATDLQLTEPQRAALQQILDEAQDEALEALTPEQREKLEAAGSAQPRCQQAQPNGGTAGG
jgi:hypothetical protein